MEAQNAGPERQMTAMAGIPAPLNLGFGLIHVRCEIRGNPNV
jgi:hypothetical protein